MNPSYPDNFGSPYHIIPSHSNDITGLCSVPNNSTNQGSRDNIINYDNNNIMHVNSGFGYQSIGDNYAYGSNQHINMTHSDINNYHNPSNPNFNNNMVQNSSNIMGINCQYSQNPNVLNQSYFDPRNSYNNNNPIVTNNNFVDRNFIKSEIQHMLHILNTLYQLLDNNGIR
ncbi:17944_t:CDS:1 [Entrophospora sp. SA101]|nr:4849_t:CDS:1 [Entrophospora sp. SA101]CAJ0859243.1 13295_t:CDS:1 [Entrophospora sp. SA101]CAJ0871712.1 17944_t:CDS:1 [Entrophospora sp. SA101]